MRFMSALLSVKDMEVSKKFYQDVLKQRVVMDIGKNVTFAGGFALQEGFAELVGFDPKSVVYGGKSGEIYFEEEDIDGIMEHLNKYEITYLHKAKEYPWGQRVIRLLDPDKHVIEIGESMEVVVKRFLRGGMSVEDTCTSTMYPLPFVLKCKSEL